MFIVIFEVAPKSDKMDAYLGFAKMLKPELEQIEGFVDNIRYRSLTHEGRILSLSSWKDEKALVRWRTQQRHHEIQEKGRNEVFRDYHLRVGQVTKDTRLPTGCQLLEQRLDETESGHGTTVTLLTMKAAPDLVKTANANEIAQGLGLIESAVGLLAWDVFDAVLTPGDVVLLLSWKDHESAHAFQRTALSNPDRRFRQVRVVRDYSMNDRHEAPQFYPSVKDVHNPAVVS